MAMSGLVASALKPSPQRRAGAGGDVNAMTPGIEMEAEETTEVEARRSQGARTSGVRLIRQFQSDPKRETAEWFQFTGLASLLSELGYGRPGQAWLRSSRRHAPQEGIANCFENEWREIFNHESVRIRQKNLADLTSVI
jgi:hypothetical protein